jgi:DNA invertase Pin-like site-specific DNA recombinase
MSPIKPRLALGYIRLSKLDEGKPGHGIGAQREAISRFCEAHGYTLLEIAQPEIQSGKGHDALERRPILADVLERARKAKATLIVSHIDRLARNVAFGSRLMEKGVQFKAVECGPDADNLYLHMKLSFAEEERRKISERFKNMWAQKRRRGDRIGNSRKLLKQLAAKGGEARRQDAITFAKTMATTIQGLRSHGLSWEAVADELNRTRTPTWSGEGTWRRTQVARVRKLACLA